jgi:hypothetical protein
MILGKIDEMDDKFQHGWIYHIVNETHKDMKMEHKKCMMFTT